MNRGLLLGLAAGIAALAYSMRSASAAPRPSGGDTPPPPPGGNDTPPPPPGGNDTPPPPPATGDARARARIESLARQYETMPWPGAPLELERMSAEAASIASQGDITQGTRELARAAAEFYRREAAQMYAYIAQAGAACAADALSDPLEQARLLGYMGPPATQAAEACMASARRRGAP